MDRKAESAQSRGRVRDRHASKKTHKEPRRKRGRTLPQFAVIGGSQAFRFLSDNFIKERIGEKNTPFGESQPVYLFDSSAGSYLFMSRHGEKGYSIAAPFVNYRANIYALKDLGVQQIVSWSGPGAISADYRIGQFVTVDDVIDETRHRSSTFYEHGGLGFIRQNPVFCPHLRALLQEALAGLRMDFSSSGVYVCTEGPRLETPAEIRKYSLLGAHMVGMTLVPEVFLARELEMCYAALCYITNYAEGVKPAELRTGVLFEGLASEEERQSVEATVRNFPRITEAMAKLTAERPSDCKCGQAMKRYRERGDVGDDWHEWIKR